MWLFKTRFGHDVSQDPFDSLLVTNCQKRDQMSAQLNNDSFEKPKFYPSVSTEVCKCEVSSPDIVL